MNPYTAAWFGYALWVQAMSSLLRELVSESLERAMEPAK